MQKTKQTNRRKVRAFVLSLKRATLLMLVAFALLWSPGAAQARGSHSCCVVHFKTYSPRLTPLKPHRTRKPKSQGAIKRAGSSKASTCSPGTLLAIAQINATIKTLNLKKVGSFKC